MLEAQLFKIDTSLDIIQLKVVEFVFEKIQNTEDAIIQWR